MNIPGMDIEIVETYKYLGVHLNNRLDFTGHNTDTILRKRAEQSCICSSESFVLQGVLLKSFYAFGSSHGAPHPMQDFLTALTAPSARGCCIFPFLHTHTCKEHTYTHEELLTIFVR